jgi:hypothetical protein
MRLSMPSRFLHRYLSAAIGTNISTYSCFDMETPAKTIGLSLQRLFAASIRRPLGWALIDAFAHLEEREEAQIDVAEALNQPHQTLR